MDNRTTRTSHSEIPALPPDACGVCEALPVEVPQCAACSGDIARRAAFDVVTGMNLAAQWDITNVCVDCCVCEET